MYHGKNDSVDFRESPCAQKGDSREDDEDNSYVENLPPSRLRNRIELTTKLMIGRGQKERERKKGESEKEKGREMERGREKTYFTR